jgi:hypothetical protein
MTKQWQQKCKAITKQSESTGRESISSIDKYINKEPLTMRPLTIEQTEKSEIKIAILQRMTLKFSD